MPREVFLDVFGTNAMLLLLQLSVSEATCPALDLEVFDVIVNKLLVAGVIVVVGSLELVVGPVVGCFAVEVAHVTLATLVWLA